MLKIIIWGTGKIAEETMRACRTLCNYDILGFVDNNIEKKGEMFWGKEVFDSSVLLSIIPDKIVILTDAYEAICRQIKEQYPQYQNIVENKNFFYKESVLKRYQETSDKEIGEILTYIKENGLDIFNYPFTRNYLYLEVEVFFDENVQLFYVLHQEHRLYISRRYKTAQSVAEYYKSILLEQDDESPHKYLSETCRVEEGAVVVDVGAAEGCFSLEVIERASKVYILEADEQWVEALQVTFRNYMDKVVIVKSFVFSYSEGEFSTLDELIQEPVDFLKLDVEGNEWDALRGAKMLISRSPNIRMAICSYHSDFDSELIESFMMKNGIKYEYSKGYMWFPYIVRQNYVSTSLNKALIRGYIN